MLRLAGVVVPAALVLGLGLSHARGKTATSHLEWGALPAVGKGCRNSSVDFAKLSKSSDATLKALAGRVVSVAKQHLNDTIPVVASLEMEHHKITDPEYKTSAAAVQGTNRILELALCARIAAPADAEPCATKAKGLIVAWARTYVPTGNPVNEGNLLPLFEAIDLLLSDLPADDATVVNDWLRKLVEASDRFYDSSMKQVSGAKPPADGLGRAYTQVSNWNTWRMAIRGLISVIVDDPALIKSSRAAIHHQVADNFDSAAMVPLIAKGAHPRPGLKAPTPSGSTTDFVVRDALHYHIFDLKAWVELVSFAPCLIEPADLAIIEGGLAFLEPFYTGKASHEEFHDSQVAFDAERGKAGDPIYVVHTWQRPAAPWTEPDDGMNRSLIRLARPRFPAVQRWTADYVTASYEPVVKLLARLWGEPLDGN